MDAPIVDYLFDYLQLSPNPIQSRVNSLSDRDLSLSLKELCGVPRPVRLAIRVCKESIRVLLTRIQY